MDSPKTVPIRLRRRGAVLGLRQVDVAFEVALRRAAASDWSDADLEVLNRAREMVRQVRVRKAREVRSDA